MKRSKRLRSDPEKQRAWERRSRRRLRNRSPRRAGKEQERDAVRTVVLERDGGCVAEGLPGVPHGPLPDRWDLEVHELRRGAARAASWLDPDWCVSVCAQAHEYATVEGYPHPARRLGLVAKASETDPDAVRARRRAAGGRA